MDAGNESQGLIGYSLSLCICDILSGRVKEPEVSRIVSSAAVPTRAAFLGLLEEYAPCYWADNPEEGKAIALRLYDAGRIDQPRLRGEPFTNLSAGGLWRTPETPEVREEGEYDARHGTKVLGLVSSPVIEQRRETATQDAMRAIKEGLSSSVPVVRRFRLKSPGLG